MELVRLSDFRVVGGCFFRRNFLPEVDGAAVKVCGGVLGVLVQLVGPACVNSEIHKGDLDTGDRRRYRQL